jgi:hypothetical protein
MVSGLYFKDSRNETLLRMVMALSTLETVSAPPARETPKTNLADDLSSW